MYKKIVVLLIISVLAFSIAACNSNVNAPVINRETSINTTSATNTTEFSEPVTEATTLPVETTEPIQEEYLACGTIPASAKITPLYREDIPMLLHYNGESAKQFALSPDEIKEITEKTDRYALLIANAGAEDYDRTELDFLSGFDNQFVWDNQEGEQKTVLDSNQIYIMGIQDSGEVHVVVIVCSTTVVQKKSYLECGMLRFIKEDGVWKIAGSKSLDRVDPAEYRYGLDRENAAILQERISSDAQETTGNN